MIVVKDVAAAEAFGFYAVNNRLGGLCFYEYPLDTDGSVMDVEAWLEFSTEWGPVPHLVLAVSASEEAEAHIFDAYETIRELEQRGIVEVVKGETLGEVV